MRNAGRMRGGFYAAPPEAVQLALKHLAPRSPGETAVLDPCAGQGAAIAQLAAGLDCPPEKCYLVELEPARAASCRQSLPGANVLGPASFFGTKIGYEAFGFIWCNPPFDHDIGGGKRTENQFLSRATDLLCDGGVMALVCPEDTADNADVRKLFKVWYDHVSIVPFPREHRKYREVIVFGVRRHSPAAPDKRHWSAVCGKARVYEIPPSHGPGRRWEKTDYTPEELIEALARSPLRRYLTPPAKRKLARPPLELGLGHQALLLASGCLDGLVCPPGEPPHVVRGSARKVEEVTDVETDEGKNSTTEKVTITERIVMSIRAVDHKGAIHTLTQE